MRFHSIAVVAVFLPVLSACTALTGPPRESTAASAPAAPGATPIALSPYLDTLARMAPGDPARQQAEIEATLLAAQQDPSSARTLRYALALGSAGHPNSNPVEAGRLITGLLSGPNTLDATETAFASAWLREFDARAGLINELARQRSESEQRLNSLDTTAERRAEALAAENRQLRRALAEAERKLEAVAEMERSLLEPANEPATDPPPRN